MRYNFYEIKEKKDYSSCGKERRVFKEPISLLSFKYPTYFEEYRLLKLILDLDDARGMKIDSRDAVKRLITEYEEEIRETEIEKQDCDLFLLWARQNMRGDK